MTKTERKKLEREEYAKVNRCIFEDCTTVRHKSKDWGVCAFCEKIMCTKHKKKLDDHEIICLFNQ